MRAVLVHDAAQAMAALAAAGPRGVALVSAPGAAGFLGPGWFLAMVAPAMAAFPDVPCRALLVCADAPGQALAALRAGLLWVVLAPEVPGFAQICAAARDVGATVLDAAPAALDLALLDLARPAGQQGLAHWLCETPDDTTQTTR